MTDSNPTPPSPAAAGEVDLDRIQRIGESLDANDNAPSLQGISLQSVGADILALVARCRRAEAEANGLLHRGVVLQEERDEAIASLRSCEEARQGK